MRVSIIATNKVVEVNNSYGARLIEQGRAVLAPAVKNSAPKAPKENSERKG